MDPLKHRLILFLDYGMAIYIDSTANCPPRNMRSKKRIMTIVKRNNCFLESRQFAVLGTFVFMFQTVKQ